MMIEPYRRLYRSYFFKHSADPKSIYCAGNYHPKWCPLVDGLFEPTTKFKIKWRWWQVKIWVAERQTRAEYAWRVLTKGF